MSIEVQSITVHSTTHVEIAYTANGEQRTLALEYDDAADFTDAISENPSAADYFARLSIQHEETNA